MQQYEWPARSAPLVVELQGIHRCVCHSRCDCARPANPSLSTSSEVGARPAARRGRRSAAGGAVELFAEDVRVSGVPGGLARHVGHDPPERVPVTVDRTATRPSGSPTPRIARDAARLLAGQVPRESRYRPAAPRKLHRTNLAMPAGPAASGRLAHTGSDEASPRCVPALLAHQSLRTAIRRSAR